MNETAINHIKEYCKSEGWDSTDDDVKEVLIEADVIFRKELSQHRWWNVYFYVVNINGMLIGYNYAEANRDESVKDLGYDFEFDSICEVESREKTIVEYAPKDK